MEICCAVLDPFDIVTEHDEQLGDRLGRGVGREMGLDDSSAELAFAAGAQLRGLLADRCPVRAGQRRATRRKKRDAEE